MTRHTRRNSDVSGAKTAESNKMPFGLWIQVVPRKHIVDGVQTPYERAIFRGKHMPGHTRRQSAVSCASTAQQLLRWATVPQQSGPKNGGGNCGVPFRGGRPGWLEMGQI